MYVPFLFGLVLELQKLGARIDLLGRTALIYGKQKEGYNSCLAPSLHFPAKTASERFLCD